MTLPIYTFLGMVAFFLVTLPIVYRLEKRLAWPFSELQAQPHFPDTTGYASRWIADAARNGFTLLGWSRDLKGETYQVTYAMLISPDRSTLAIVGVGALLKMSLQGTWLHTPTMDGRSFYSTDKQAGVQIDLSGNWMNQLVPVPTFTQLFQRHKAWLQEQGVTAKGFAQGREVEEFRSLREQHYRFMERAGLINYIDPSQSRFQFTVVGATKTATWSYLLGLARAVTDGKFPRTA